MKKNVLWICNLVFPEVAEQIGIPVSYAGGWLLGASQELKKSDDFNLHILTSSRFVNEVVEYSCHDINYIVIPNENYSIAYNSVKQKIEPCLVHVFGTEMPHSWSAFDVFSKTKVVISIQGLVSECAKFYYADLPHNIIHRKRFYEFITGDTIVRQKREFFERGLREIDVLKKAKYVMGRTEWDESVVKNINPSITYLKCNETLRSVFYNYNWDIDKIEKYSILISQGSNPMKGLHYAIQGLEGIRQKFPKAKLYVAGDNLLKNAKYGRRWKMSSYAKYIYDMIRTKGLDNHVVFLGNMNEHQMCERYLKTHVFLCPSVLENSSNSLGEAMLIGTPCVASSVGGTPSMLMHETEGYLYKHDSVKDMVNYVEKIFEDDCVAEKLSRNAKTRAKETHNPQKNNQQLMDHYKQILGDR